MSASSSMNARILYWGIEGAGKTTNLEKIRAKLRADHRGELCKVPTRIDSTVFYESLQIQLGDVSGVPTRIEIVTVPDGDEQQPTRMQLLDEVSGLALILDASPERVEENRASCDELILALSAYGRALEDLPVVVQYNKTDRCDTYAIEELHRELALPADAVFESVASEGDGVLQTLTTLSKRVVRELRDRRAAEAGETREGDGPEASDARTDARPLSASPATATAPEEQMSSGNTRRMLDSDSSDISDSDSPAFESSEPESTDSEPESSAHFTGSAAEMLENAMAAEAEGAEEDDAINEAAEASSLERDARAAFDRPFDDLAREVEATKPRAQLGLGPGLRIVSVGTATIDGERGVRIPLVLGDPDGATASLSLSIRLDPLLDDGD